MKKTELPNCPQWLLDADTFNEDVEIFQNRIIWNGGQFLGGYFRGGQFLGGEFRGGYFRGGEFLGGEFLGGEFLGGQFLGGEFLGGEFRGGLTCIRLKWPILVDNHGNIKIGCKLKTVKEWDTFFNSEDEFETPRGSEVFKQIQAAFEAYKAYLAFLNK